MATTAPPPSPEAIAALRRWYADPVAYFREVLGVTTLWDRQIEMMESVRDNRETYVPAGHSVSKDFTAGRLVCWWITTRKGLVITTANTREQVRDVLWGELRDAHAQAKIPLGGDLMPADTRWSFAPKWYAIGLTARETNAFQGKHADEVLVIGDEAGGLPSWVFLALASCATGDRDRQLFLGNLTCGPEHEFAKECRAPNIPGVRKVVRIPSWESPNVKAGRTVIPGVCTQTYIDDIVRRFGLDSAIYNARVAARDPMTASNSLIGYDHIQKAKDRRAALPEHWTAPESCKRRLGCDVARYGRHTTRIWLAAGPHAEHLETITKMDGPSIARRLVYHYRAHKCESVAVDGGGLGSGVVDSLHDLRKRDEAPPDMKVYDVQFGAGPSVEMEAEVGNKRTELYWRLRDWLQGEAAVELEEAVVDELIAPTYTYQGKPQRIFLEPKEELEKRLGRSPDDADALALAVAGHLGAGDSMFTGAPPQGAADPYADPDPGHEEDDDAPRRRDVYDLGPKKPWAR